MSKTLTDSFIRNYPNPQKRTEISDDSVQGLAIRISSTGYKSFVYRYKFNSETKRYTLGKYPDLTLAEARELSKDMTAKVRLGIDPILEKRSNKDNYTDQKFEVLAERFLSNYVPTLRGSTQYNYRIIIESRIIPEFGSYQINSITQKMIVNYLDKIAYEQGKTTYANRIRARLSTIFNYGIKRDLAKQNPVSGSPKYNESSRERYYTEKEIKELWNGFETIHEPTQSIFKMLLLLGQRKSETMKMRWRDLEFDNDIWIIPKEIAKNKQMHHVPLSPMAIELIEGKSKATEYVFSYKGRHLKNIRSSINKIREITSVKDFRVHDLRRTTATFLAKLGADRTVVGKILNHKGLANDSAVTAIYDRYSYAEEKRAVLDNWNNKLQEIIS